MIKFFAPLSKGLLLTMAFLSLLGNFEPSAANDAGYEGDGVTVFPVINNSVRLVSERVILTLDDGFNWQVDASLHFENETGKHVAVQMGFPFERWWPGSDGGLDELTDEEAKELGYVKNAEAQPSDGELNFKTWIDGQPAKAERRKGIRSPRLPNMNHPVVYVTTVRFAPNQKRTLRHTYKVGGIGYSNGEHIVKYILRTGALWSKPIEKSEIEVRLKPSEADRLHCVSPKEKTSRIDGDLLVLAWEYKNFRPDFDIELATHDAVFSLTKDGLSEIEKEFTDAKRVSDNYWLTLRPCAARFYKNLIYAHYGYPFKSAFVRSQFYGSNHYALKPKKSFNAEKIGSLHQEILKYLISSEK